MRCLERRANCLVMGPVFAHEYDCKDYENRIPTSGMKHSVQIKMKHSVQNEMKHRVYCTMKFGIAVYIEKSLEEETPYQEFCTVPDDGIKYRRVPAYCRRLAGSDRSSKVFLTC